MVDSVTFKFAVISVPELQCEWGKLGAKNGGSNFALHSILSARGVLLKLRWILAIVYLLCVGVVKDSGANESILMMIQLCLCVSDGEVDTLLIT